MYVKKEALLSSQIGDTQASLEDVFAYERGETLENINDITEVINYIKALYYGMERLSDLPMSLRSIKEIHAILLQGVRCENKTPGEFRKTQNWIGHAGCLLQDASFVPPLPAEVPALWINFFLNGIVETSNSAINTAKSIIDLQNCHRKLIWEKRFIYYHK